jgi:hypothetical protein
MKLPGSSPGIDEKNSGTRAPSGKNVTVRISSLSIFQVMVSPTLILRFRGKEAIIASVSRPAPTKRFSYLGSAETGAAATGTSRVTSKILSISTSVVQAAMINAIGSRAARKIYLYNSNSYEY